MYYALRCISDFPALYKPLAYLFTSGCVDDVMLAHCSGQAEMVRVLTVTQQGATPNRQGRWTKCAIYIICVVDMAKSLDLAGGQATHSLPSPSIKCSG